MCKDCQKAKNAQHYQSNKDAILKKAADYYQSNKDAILKKADDYYQTNKDKIAQKKAQYYQEHKEKIAQKKAQYYQEHKEKIAEYYAEYYNPQTHPMNWAKNIVAQYRKMDRERGFDTSKTISAEWFLQNIAYKPCKYCGKQGIGLIGCNRIDNSKGHTQDNVEAACMSCNSRLGAIYQLERGIHISQLRKKQSFKEFVEEHKAKDKNLT